MRVMLLVDMVIRRAVKVGTFAVTLSAFFVMLLGQNLFTRHVFLAIDNHVELRGGNPISLNPRQLQRGTHVQRRHGLLQ